MTIDSTYPQEFAASWGPALDITFGLILVSGAYVCVCRKQSCTATNEQTHPILIYLPRAEVWGSGKG